MVSAYCSYPDCFWTDTQDAEAYAFMALLEHEEETGHDRHKHGHIAGAQEE